jgi:hypothetical protein
MLWPVEADFDGYLLRGADVLRLCLSFQYKAGPEGLVSKKKRVGLFFGLDYFVKSCFVTLRKLLLNQ